jgi:hypothetical protein
MGQLEVLSLTQMDLKGSLPDSWQNLKNIKELVLSDNKFHGPMPESVLRKMPLLCTLNLSNNKFTGEVPKWLNDCSQLIHCDIRYNEFSGRCPVLVKYRLLADNNPDLVLPFLNTYFDHFLFILYIVLGYADLISDILAIIEIHAQHRMGLVILNICVLGFKVLVDVIYSEAWSERVQTLLQINIITESFHIWTNNIPAIALSRSKHIDAICRSIPSMLIQLYALLTAWESLGNRGVTTLIISICLGLGSSSMTFGTLQPTRGSIFYDGNWLLWCCYYNVALMTKIVSYTMLFTSVKAFGFVVMGVEWIVRFYICCDKTYTFDSMRNSIIHSLPFLSKETSLQDVLSEKRKIVICHVTTVMVAISALVIFNLSINHHLENLRTDHVHVPLIILLCVGILMYCAIFFKLGVDDETFDSVVQFPFMYLL